MRDIKNYIIGFLSATCLFLFMGHASKLEKESDVRFFGRIICDSIEMSDNDDPYSSVLISPSHILITSDERKYDTVISSKGIELKDASGVKDGIFLKKEIVADERY